MKRYLTNKDHYYFTLDGYDYLVFPDCCREHDTLESMYQFVADKCDLEFEEVEASDFLIKDGKCVDDRGIASEIEGDIVEFIVDFVM